MFIGTVKLYVMVCLCLVLFNNSINNGYTWHNICSTCSFICCMLYTVKCYVPWALLLYILYTVYCHLFVLWALLCFVVTCMLYCCMLCAMDTVMYFMYCMWCVSTTDILLHCASRQGYFLLMVCLCATLLYVIIDHGVPNDCTDIISLIYSKTPHTSVFEV